jgi:hypothetical protein
MRKFPLLIAAAIPAAAIAALSVPAFGEGREAGEGGCVAQPTAMTAGPLDLDKIPVKAVNGPQSVKGVGGCEEDDGFIGKVAAKVGAIGHDGLGERGEHGEGFADD